MLWHGAQSHFLRGAGCRGTCGRSGHRLLFGPSFRSLGGSAPQAFCSLAPGGRWGGRRAPALWREGRLSHLTSRAPTPHLTISAR